MSQPEKNSTKFSLKARLNSFIYAFKGIKTLFRSEHNARIHLVAAIIAVMAGYHYNINKTEWLFVILSITIVFLAELFNSSIEFLADIVQPSYHEKIGKVKDMAAAAVLVSALFA